MTRSSTFWARILPMPSMLGQVLAGQQHVLDGDRVIADAFGGLDIGADLEFVLVFQGKEKGHLVKNPGDFLVGHAARSCGKTFFIPAQVSSAQS